MEFSPFASRGKQLPEMASRSVAASSTADFPVAPPSSPIAAKQSPPTEGDDAATHQANTKHKERTDSSSRVGWKMRDDAIQMLCEREDMLKHSTSMTSSSSLAVKKQSLLLSSKYDTEASLARILRTKADMVRLSFDAAANVVVQAVSASTFGQNQEESLNKQDAPILSLPASVSRYESLHSLRVQSLERSFENKEYTKRKGGKVDPPRSNKYKRPATTTAKKTATQPSVLEKAALSSPSRGKTVPVLVAPPSVTSTDPNAPDAATNSTSTASVANTLSNTTPEAPKFTRNTPASSAAALDFRFQSARAILCATANLTFEALTPAYSTDRNKRSGDSEGERRTEELDVRDVPQNAAHKTTSLQDTATVDETAAATRSSSTGEPTSAAAINMGAVVVEAQKLGQRTISIAESAVRRSALRYKFRKDNAIYDAKDDLGYLKLENLCQWKEDHPPSVAEEESLETDENDGATEDNVIPHQPNNNSLTYEWKSACLPRLLSVLDKGAGHAIYHDLNWPLRHGRIADLMRGLVEKDNNFGPHLIVTTEPEIALYIREFYDIKSYLGYVTSNESKSLLAIAYQGTKKQRRKLRGYFPEGKGLAESPFHVIVTSYQSFLEDYIHFCQLPLESTIFDDGVAWMAAAMGDTNSAMCTIWESAIFSRSDKQVGLAGATFAEWDFTEDNLSERDVRDACIGLTTRHRIMTASRFNLQTRYGLELVPVSGLVNFIAPHFADVVREEWDRSRITSEKASMDHFRKLVARSIVVHPAISTSVTATASTKPEVDLRALALAALSGEINFPYVEDTDRPQVPQIVDDDEFVSQGKASVSRKTSLAWLGAPEQSWLRYELGTSDMHQIVWEFMKVSNMFGCFCEEITTASSTTTTGANGQVAGSMAFRPAIRCGRHFGSEQGLRQHISAMHAPPGTWLCRTCGSDCITSQARTHHERSCGQPVAGSGDGVVGATPTVGQGGNAKGSVGKKKGGRPPSTQNSTTNSDEKDPDGSFRVRGYRGVWVNTAGQHFIKIDGKRIPASDEGDDALFFDVIDDAARKHDELSKKKKKAELNFKPDGSRVIYEDAAPAPTGVAGTASNVVPALAVINIKDLPSDVKPLLRDPRQTSRTGGNSKRHVYAYRGVCRQARKGHDRWQSQISFMGVNHYLGTFDSEWDAAAIYAWAHLILYGEEATRQAQKEGEEAAAAYEQEKRDIAAGKIPEPPPKPEKVKKKKEPKKKVEKKTPKKDTSVKGDEGAGGTSKKRKAAAKEGQPPEKKVKVGTTTKTVKIEKDVLNPLLAKGVTKAPILAPRDIFESTSDSELGDLVKLKLAAAQLRNYRVSDSLASFSPAAEVIRPCIAPLGNEPNIPGVAMLVGLSPALAGWDLEDFIEESQVHSVQDSMTVIQMLALEYDEDGANEKFKSVLQNTVCVLGQASSVSIKMYKSLGFGKAPVGGTIGGLDCHVGGVPGSCGEKAACIRYDPADTSDFFLDCLNEEDVVTLNGERVIPSTGGLPLKSEDVCSVGPRVFAFIVPTV